MKKVLILTANKTGTGHKSSANAIENKLKLLGYDAKQLNCFSLMGKMGVKMEESYIPLTTKHPFVWKISHSFSQIFTNTLHNFMYLKSKKELLKEILDYNPDLIISVHCMFTKAVSKLLRKNNLKIPFMVNVIDLINPPRVWRDKSADMVFVPTNEVKADYIKRGFDEKKLVVSGFPIREDIVRLSEPKHIEKEVNILMVNPSINVKTNEQFLLETAKLKNRKIRVICGRDEVMFKRLTELKNSNENLKDVEILGFVTNMNEHLRWCHILLTKAGPNMLLEGTRSGSCVVVTGHIPGQEAKNYQYITENGFGIKCENPKNILSSLKNLVETKEIEKVFKNVLNADCNDGAKIIAENIDKFLNK